MYIKKANAYIALISILLLVMFYAALLFHVSVSFSRALITLGWLCDDAKRRALDRILLWLCAVVFVLLAVITVHTHISLINLFGKGFL